jgi:putative phosphoesterase
MRVGVISDTHGLLRPAALDALTAPPGVDLILHAGDVGDDSILDELGNLAPVTAIRGNVDIDGPCALLPATEYVTVAGYTLYMLHDLGRLDLQPGAAGVAAVIYGHSHKPSIEWRKGVLFFNPGAAGPRRFSQPVSLGFLELTAQGIEPKLITLL